MVAITGMKMKGNVVEWLSGRIVKLLNGYMAKLQTMTIVNNVTCNNVTINF